MYSPMGVELEQMPPIVVKPGKTEPSGLRVVDTVDTREQELVALTSRFPHQDVPIKTILRQPGARVYLPVGSERKPRARSFSNLYREIRYLPKRWHREAMRASVWELIPAHYLHALGETSYYGIGLSVGAAILWAVGKLGAIDRYTIGDPDTMDAVNGGRHVWWDPEVSGWNKTTVAHRELTKLDPYLTVRTFPKGLTTENKQAFFRGVSRLKGIIIQEVDDPSIKDLAHSYRETTRMQIGDVGHSHIVVTVDKPGDLPFGGRTAGRNGMDALLASVDNHIGKDLRTLFPRIGKDKEITTVPQDFGAVLLAATVARHLICPIAAGEYDRVPRIATLSVDEGLKVWES